MTERKLKNSGQSSDSSESNSSDDEPCHNEDEPNTLSTRETRNSVKRKRPYNSKTKCRFCGTIFLNVERITKHEKNCESRKSANIFITFDGKMRFVCTICNKIFKYQTGLKKHKLRHKPPGGFVCSQCNERFLTDTERLLHKECIHKIFECLICNIKFTSEELFTKHIGEKHDGRDREYVVCTDCGAQFRQPNQLRLHNESKCGTVRCYSCQQCNSKFMTQNTLNAHMLIHVGEKKHLCDFCGSSYLSRGQLKVHERSHTGEKPFKCDVCDKAFSHRESLVTHSSVHNGIKPYLCEGCGNRFSCIGNLIKHKRARPQTCGLPQFSKNTKCAPRASSKNAGSLTMKKSPKPKRHYTKRKAMSVPELLAVRVEMTNTESNSINEKLEESTEIDGDINAETVVPDDDSEFTELLVSDKHNEGPLKDTYSENEFDLSFDVATVEEISVYNDESVSDSNWKNQKIGSHTHVIETESIQLDEQPTFAYNVSDIVIVTSDGNYLISNYNENSEQKSEEVILPVTANAHNHSINSENIVILNDTNLTVQDQENKEEEQVIEFRNVVVDNLDYVDTIIEENEDDGGAENDLVEYLDYEPITKPRSKKSKKTTSNDSTKMYNCEECPGEFKYKKSFLKHMEDHHQNDSNNSNVEIISKKPMLCCQFCHKKYTSEKILAKHVVCHGSDGKLIHKCPCCILYFETDQMMREHTYDKHKTKLTCTCCGKLFKEPDCLTAHIRYVHLKSGDPAKRYAFICTKCGKKFNTRVAMSDHERADCGRAPIYKCNDCEKSYHSAGSLKTHQLIHSGDLPHTCKFCGKGFRTQGQVKVHERSHNGEKPFTCDYCQKKFAHRESLLTHLSLHTGIKRFMCQGCSSRFSCISNLQAHRKSHKTTCGMLPIMTKPVWSVDGSLAAPISMSENDTEEIANSELTVAT